MPASRPLRPPARATAHLGSHLYWAALAAILVACAPTDRASPVRPPDLVLISLDTFRADLLETARADGSPELPALRALADESLWFTNAWSPQPFTLPAHMTMLTGLHPETHGVDDAHTQLAVDVPTLAMLLRDAGYATVGVSCEAPLDQRYGFARGFDVYNNFSGGLTYADRVRNRALAALSGLPPDRPRFLFAHFFDAHGDPQRKGNKLTYYSPPEYRRGLDVPEQAICVPGGECAMAFLTRLDAGATPPSPDFAAIQFELYRRGARALDDDLKTFFDALRGAGIWDDAVVIVTADHGEEFGEHGGYQHEQIFRETLRVPVLVRLPRRERAGERDARPAALEDIAPTLLARAGVAAPASMLGLDLLARSRSGAARPLVARQRNDKLRFALRLADRLLVRNTASGERRVFDLVADPGETRVLAVGATELTRLEERLDATLRRLRAGRSRAGNQAPPLSEQEAAELRALGYLQ